VKEAFLLFIRFRAPMFEGTASTGNGGWEDAIDGWLHEAGAIEAHTLNMVTIEAGRYAFESTFSHRQFVLTMRAQSLPLPFVSRQ
jgi:hypothetical protein